VTAGFPPLGASPEGAGQAADSRTRFGSRVRDYVASRPGYPPGLIPLLAREAGLAPGWEVADLGSGTGLSALPFLEAGCRVLGVDPDSAMRKAAEAFLDGWDGFTSVMGSAEATGLPDESVELVVAAQAVHWFDAVGAGREAGRILRPGGRRVVVFNTRLTDASPFLSDYESLLLEHGTDYREVRHDRLDPERLDAFLGGAFRSFALENRQLFTLEGLRTRIHSSSYVPAPGERGYPALMEEVKRLFHRHAVDGRVEFLYSTEVHLGGGGSGV